MKTPVLLLMFATLLMTACSGPQEPEFKALKNVKVSSINITEGLNIQLSGDAVFTNPNALGVDVSGMDVDVYVNGKKVSTIDQDLTARMTASSDFTLPLKFNIPVRSVIDDIKGGLIKDLFKKKKIDIKLDGIIKVKTGSVELNVPFDYEEVHEI